MERDIIEKLIIKQNLIDESFAIVVCHSDDEYIFSIDLIDSEPSGYYKNKTLGKFSEKDNNDGGYIGVFLEIARVLRSFGCQALVFDKGTVYFCRDSWDGFQPVLFFEDYYNPCPIW